VFILEHYFTSKSCAVICEAFSNAYADKKVQNKYKNTPNGNISVHRMSLSVTSAHRATKQLKLRPYRFQAVH
jgi:hypothetical protein